MCKIDIIIFSNELQEKDRRIKHLKQEKEGYEQKQEELQHELRSMQAEIDLLTNQIDVSEIISEQGFAPTNAIMNGELMIAIEGLAKDIGYSLSNSMHRNNNEIE